jgi:hypothetical protein
MLDGRAHAEVRHHLDVCEECRRELRVLDGVMALVEEQGFRQPPVGLFNGVRNRIESGDVVRERAPWWSWMFTAPARAAAMGMAVAAVALALFLPAGPGQNIPPMLNVHGGDGIVGNVASNTLAGSIRQHALSAGEGSLTDRVAWEAVAQLVIQDRDEERKRLGVE